MLLGPIVLNGFILAVLVWKNSSSLKSDKLVPIFLLCFSLTTMNDDRIAADIQLGILYLLLILYYLEYLDLLILLTKIIRFAVVVEVAMLAFLSWI